MERAAAGLGVGVAYVYSMIATVLPGIFPESFIDEAGEVAVYFEAAAVITTLVLLGQVLELRARSQTGAAIRALLGLGRIPRDGFATTAGRRTCRSIRCSPVTGCAYGPAKRCRSTVWFSKARVPSMNRW